MQPAPLKYLANDSKLWTYHLLGKWLLKSYSSHAWHCFWAEALTGSKPYPPPQIFRLFLCRASNSSANIYVVAYVHTNNIWMQLWTELNWAHGKSIATVCGLTQSGYDSATLSKGTLGTAYGTLWLPNKNVDSQCSQNPILTDYSSQSMSDTAGRHRFH